LASCPDRATKINCPSSVAIRLKRSRSASICPRFINKVQRIIALSIEYGMDGLVRVGSRMIKDVIDAISKLRIGSVL